MFMKITLNKFMKIASIKVYENYFNYVSVNYLD